MSRITTILILQFIILIYLCQLIIEKYNWKKQPKLMNSTYLKEKYRKSRNYIINNNLAQYSVYLSQFENKCKIEAYVFFNYKYLKDLYVKENYLCLVKLVNLKNYTEKEDIIELNATRTYSYYFGANRRFTFEFSPSDFKSYHVDKRNFNLNQIVVGVIRKDDYNKTLSETMLNDQLDWSSIYNYDKIALPYSFISYQWPIIVDKIKNVSKTVSSCLHFTYGTVAGHLENWIDIHLSFGIAEIVIYDGTSNFELTEKFQNKYKRENRLKIVPYRINQTDLCSRLPKTEFAKIEELLKKYCLKFHELEFKNFISGRSKHEQITSNDCYTQMSKKHEFITYYDADEFVFPRSFDIDMEPSFDYDNKTSFCSKEPFQPKDTGMNGSSMYFYIDGLVEKYRDGRDKDKLSSISFDHAAYLVANNESDKLIQDLGSIINKNNNATQFPIKVVFGDPKNKRGHTFIIEKEDLDHAKRLFKEYKSIFQPDKKFLISKLDSTLQRSLVLITEHQLRWPKCIYYHKNVNALFIHYPTDLLPDTWQLKPNAIDGHFLSHFRKDSNVFFQSNLESSIKKLKIDLEYLRLYLKKYSSICDL